MRGVVRPGADNISRAVFGMAGGVAVGDPQAPEVNEIVRPVALVHGGGPGAGMQADFGILRAEGLKGRDVVFVRVSDKNVPEL